MEEILGFILWNTLMLYWVHAQRKTFAYGSKASRDMA